MNSSEVENENAHQSQECSARHVPIADSTQVTLDKEVDDPFGRAVKNAVDVDGPVVATRRVDRGRA